MPYGRGNTGALRKFSFRMPAGFDMGVREERAAGRWFAGMYPVRSLATRRIIYIYLQAENQESTVNH